jgi:hypothetical protein
MKNQLISFFFVSSLTVIGLVNSKQVYSQSDTSSQPATKNVYSCVQRNGNPATVVDTKRGRVELIVWKSEFFSKSEWTPQRRCEEVTKRFQEFSDTDQLRYVSTGRMNNQPVICTADKIPGDYVCKEDGLLITLEPKDNPTEVLKNLFDINSRIEGGGIVRGDGIDMNYLLDNLPLIESNDNSINNMTSEKTTPEEPISEDNSTICPPLLCE